MFCLGTCIKPWLRMTLLASLLPTWFFRSTSLAKRLVCPLAISSLDQGNFILSGPPRQPSCFCSKLCCEDHSLLSKSRSQFALYPQEFRHAFPLAHACKTPMGREDEIVEEGQLREKWLLGESCCQLFYSQYQLSP